MDLFCLLLFFITVYFLRKLSWSKTSTVALTHTDTYMNAKAITARFCSVECFPFDKTVIEITVEFNTLLSSCMFERADSDTWKRR